MNTTARRRVGPARANHPKIAASLTDDLLIGTVRQLQANSTGQTVVGVRPQFTGLPRAARSDADRLPHYEAECRRRGLNIDT